MPALMALTPEARRSGSEASSEAETTPSFGGSSRKTPEEEPATPPSASAPQERERDRLLHWWCLKNLPRYLRRLSRCEEAGPFREPLPWRELGLEDYLEVVERPMDLRTIQETLDAGGYADSAGLVDPDLLWEDVALCWENCLVYYEGEEGEVEACALAEAMRERAEEWEEEFWGELEAFEASLSGLDPRLQRMAAVTDVAARAVEERHRELAR